MVGRDSGRATNVHYRNDFIGDVTQQRRPTSVVLHCLVLSEVLMERS